jgi:glycosyltransferase involved in cell wall biosynthesis
VNRPLRLLIWSSIPTHHQAGFFGALRERNIDLVVHYYQRVHTERLNMGWSDHSVLPPGERYVRESLRSMEACPDWRERIHVVPGYGIVFLLRLAWFLSRHRIPWLHWSEHSEPTLRSHLTFAAKRIYGRLVRRHAMGALAIGEPARLEFIRWGVDANMIRFLPYAVPGVGDQRAAQPDLRARATRFLFLGQLIPRKGIDLLLQAMKNVLATCPDARLELAGTDRSNGRYARAAARLGIRHAVEFSGMIEARNVATVLRRCDVFTLPSRHDGWGVVLNEAASAGKPIIASDACGAAHHLALPRVNGFRFPSGSVAGLTEAMLAYCRDPTLTLRHGAESLRIFEEFTPRRNAQRLEEALDSLLESQARGARVGAAHLGRAH